MTEEINWSDSTIEIVGNIISFWGFKENHGLHCGFCTPGMMLRAIELLEKNPDPTEEEIRWGISGNLCRCTGYNNIVKSIKYAGAKLRGDELPSTEPVFVE